MNLNGGSDDLKGMTAGESSDASMAAAGVLILVLVIGSFVGVSVTGNPQWLLGLLLALMVFGVCITASPGASRE